MDSKALKTNITFTNICYKVTSKTEKNKRLLHNITGKIEAGDLVALLGPSGAGKTTLLNIYNNAISVLAGKVKQSSGDIRINEDLASESDILKNHSCYIQHDDVFFGQFTVKEHLLQQVALSLAVSKKREEVANNLIEQYSLTHVENTFIGDDRNTMGRGISGGEKKRLSIASSLISNPSLVFADEPTSGLDSYMSYSVALTLKQLSDTGRTVLASIHQPSSEILFLFKKVILLSEGHLIYIGPVKGALTYFSSKLRIHYVPNQSPAEFLLEQLSTTTEDTEGWQLKIFEWSQKWNSSGEKFLKTEDLSDEAFAKKYPNLEAYYVPKTPEINSIKITSDCVAENDTQRPSTWSIFNILFKRSLMSTLRNKAVFRARLIQIFFTSLTISLFYFRLADDNVQEKIRALMLILINIAFMFAYLTLTRHLTDVRPIYRELEKRLYHPGLYFITKSVSDSLVDIYIPITSFTVTWWMCGINDTFWRFIVGLGYYVLFVEAIKSLAYFIASNSESIDQGATLMPMLLVTYLLVSNLFLRLETLMKFWYIFYVRILTPCYVLQYSSPFNFGFSALLRAAFYEYQIPGTSTNVSITHYDFDERPIRWLIDALALITWILPGRLLSLLIFIAKNKH